jgi:sulfur-oxidizing protein SoxZ
MQPTIRIKAGLNGETTEVQTLIKHPMDSGFAKDETGSIIPSRYIETISVEHAGRTVFSANWGPMIAKDPYLRFSFKGGKIGDMITVSYVDSTAVSSSATASIEADSTLD